MTNNRNTCRARARSIRLGAVALALALQVLALATTGCGLIAKTRRLTGGRLPVQIALSDQLNQNSPVAVDLVVVYDKKFLARLEELSARDWFEKRDQFLRDYPDAFESWLWEWTPDQEAQSRELDVKIGAKGGVVFADYFSPGQHRAFFNPHKPIRLSLEDREFMIEEQR
jgi:type VI secretion system protein